MPWTAPKTWTQTFVDEADLNTHVRDNLLWLRSASEVAFAYRNTTGPLIPAATWTAQGLDAEGADTYGGFAAPNPYIQVPSAGIVRASYAIWFLNYTGTGLLGGRLTQLTSGAVVITSFGFSYGNEVAPSAAATAMFAVSAGDLIRLEAYSNTSGTQASIGIGSQLMVEMVRPN